MVEDSLAKVDYLIRVDDIPQVLVEVKSPSVIQNVGKKLPSRGIKLSWLTGAPPQVRILAKVSTLFDSLTIIIFKVVCGRPQNISAGGNSNGFSLHHIMTGSSAGSCTVMVINHSSCTLT